MTAEWLGETLALRYPGIEVTSFDVRDVLHGFATKLLLDIETNEIGTDSGNSEPDLSQDGFRAQALRRRSHVLRIGDGGLRGMAR